MTTKIDMTAKIDEYNIEFTQAYTLFKKTGAKMTVSGDEPCWAIFDGKLREFLSILSQHPEYLQLTMQIEPSKLPIFVNGEKPPK